MIFSENNNFKRRRHCGTGKFFRIPDPFQFINKFYRGFFRKNFLLQKLSTKFLHWYNIEQDPDSVFFKRSDPDSVQSRLDLQHWFKTFTSIMFCCGLNEY
jgi:hypothetical protein